MIHKITKIFLSFHIRCTAIALIICLLSSDLALVTMPAPLARADFGAAISNCLARWDYSHHQADSVSNSIQVNGAGYTNWNSPVGLYNLNVFWVQGGGSTRIDYWGTTKW